MNERRRFRRSSPDAPQGKVAVLTVFLGLVAVAVIAGVGFVGSDGGSSERSPEESVAPHAAGSDVGPTSVAPTTALIRGATSTTLFVTTTTPITTTTTTTTTTLPGPPLDPGVAEVVFGPGVRSVAFTVRTSSPDPLEFDVTGVPDGMTASPTHATVTQASPVTITLTITDQDRAGGGTIVLVGSDGSRVPVRVTVQSAAPSVAGVSFDPDPPVCGRPVRLLALVTGGGVSSVSASVAAAGGRSTVQLKESAPGAWSAALPGGPAGSSISGTVVATASNGQTARKGFSTVIAHGPGC